MHYTSPQNIHRLIDPLFLDKLKAELNGLLTAQGVGDRKRRNELTRFHDKIAGLRFLDPAFMRKSDVSRDTLICA